MYVTQLANKENDNQICCLICTCTHQYIRLFYILQIIIMWLPSIIYNFNVATLYTCIIKWFSWHVVHLLFNRYYISITYQYVTLQCITLTRVAVVEFQVSLYPNSVSPFSPLYTRYMCEYNDLKSQYSAERLYNSSSTSSSFSPFSSITLKYCHSI